MDKKDMKFLNRGYWYMFQFAGRSFFGKMKESDKEKMETATFVPVHHPTSIVKTERGNERVYLPGVSGTTDPLFINVMQLQTISKLDEKAQELFNKETQDLFLKATTGIVEAKGSVLDDLKKNPGPLLRNV